MKSLNLTEKDDNELFCLFKRGVVSAFDELYNRHFQPLVSFLQRSYSLSKPDAEDLAQEAFIRAYRNRHSFTPDRGTVVTWIYTSAKRRAISFYRSARYRRTESLVQEDDNGEEYTLVEESDLFPTPDRAAESRDVRRAINAAMNALKPHYRNPANLILQDGLKYREAADRLELPLGTVKSRMYRAKGKLKTSLQYLRS